MEHKDVKDRLDQDLWEDELEEFAKQIPWYFAESGQEVQKMQVDKAMVAGVIKHVAVEFPDWAELPPLEEIWTTTAIQKVRRTLRNQLRAQDKLKKEVAALKPQSAVAEEVGEEQIVDQEEEQSQRGPRRSGRKAAVKRTND